MKNLRLISYIHRQQKIIKVAFAYDLELIELIKSQKSDRWSQSIQSWYFPKKIFNSIAFTNRLKARLLSIIPNFKKHPPLQA